MTISDVARVAQVSKATVSRVLNRPEIVAPDVNARIHKAMAELNYQPNRHARALSGVRTKTVGLLFFKDLWDLVLNPFWGMATSTVYEHLLRNDLDCNLIALGESITANERFSTPARYEQFLRSRNVDGFLVVGHMKPEMEEYLANSEVPAVIWGRPRIPDSGLSYTDSDHKRGAEIGVDHLVAIGRRDIGTITGDLDLEPARDRFDGYRASMQLHGRDPRPSLVAQGDFTRESGFSAMLRLLDRNEGLDAVFAANDEMALGALEALRERGLTAPDDVAVVGFDNVTLPQPGHIQRLTTVSHPYEEIGAELVAGLLARMRGEHHESRLIAPTLVLGQTA